LFTIFDTLDYEERVDKLAKRRGRAKELGLTECTGCGACCARMPCVPTPAEVYLIAEFLRMRVEDCVRKYFVVYWLPKRPPYLLQAKTSWLSCVGNLVERSLTFEDGYCIFYDEDNRTCKIDSVKPRVGREYKCWNTEQLSFIDQTYKSWEGVDLELFGARPPFIPVDAPKELKQNG